MTTLAEIPTANVCIMSPCRDSGDFIETFIEQLIGLEYPPDRLRFVIVEGDSVDSTFARLCEWQERDDRVYIVKHDTGRARFPSSVSAARFAHLAEIINKGVERVVSDNWADYVLAMPSDVQIAPDLLTSLLEADKDLIAPMFWTGDNGAIRFYDIWGFRHQGRSFRPGSPAWFRANFPQEPVQMDTIGGVILMRSEVLRQGCRYTPEEVDHGLCKMAQEKGFTTWCHPLVSVFHT